MALINEIRKVRQEHLRAIFQDDETDHVEALRHFIDNPPEGAVVVGVGRRDGYTRSVEYALTTTPPVYFTIRVNPMIGTVEIGGWSGYYNREDFWEDEEVVKAIYRQIVLDGLPREVNL